MIAASLRFLGRRVYLGLVVVLVPVIRHGTNPTGVRRLRELVGVSRRTVERLVPVVAQRVRGDAVLAAGAGAVPMGRAARDVERRMLASAGLMTEAKPVFAEPAYAVAHGGVLAALPMLLREGLLGAANRLFRLPNGFYGLTTILLFVACMTLARVRNPEGLRYQAPGEWGAILGLDRCPEPKTLRRKIRLLASAEHTVRDWQSALAHDWATNQHDLSRHRSQARLRVGRRSAPRRVT